jgi:V/A-type H+/Na+-transporting ATPase subunit D
MKVRHPAGRAGRPWLAHRLEVARRGAELLADKQRALMREHARLEPLLAQARSDWELRAREAERWLARAAMLGGERQLDFLPSALAQLTVSWRTILGVRCPADPQLELPSERELVPAGASAAVYGAATAHRRALKAAVRVGVAERALERIQTDLRATTLRRVAIERRWIPAHERALAALELGLDEVEREDSARVRRITGSDGSAVTRANHQPETGGGGRTMASPA